MPLNTLQSLRYGTRLFWKTNNFYNLYNNDFLFLELKLRNYFKSIFNMLMFNHKKLVKTYYSKKSLLLLKNSKFKSPLLLGSTQIKYKNNTLHIYLNYYFDLVNSHPDKVSFFKSKILLFKNTLIKLLTVKILIIDYNYNQIFLAPIFSSKSNFKSTANSLLPNISRFNHALYSVYYYKKISLYYAFFIKNLYKFKKNRYFFRILNVLFSSFLLKYPDLTLTAESVTYELRALRKQHKRFMLFVKEIFKIFFDLFKTSYFLIGLKLTFKGRITLFNRECQRKIKKIYNFGKNATTSDFNVKVTTGSSEAFTRFGAISFTVSMASNINKFVAKNSYDFKNFLTDKDLNTNLIACTSAIYTEYIHKIFYLPGKVCSLILFMFFNYFPYSFLMAVKTAVFFYNFFFKICNSSWLFRFLIKLKWVPVGPLRLKRINYFNFFSYFKFFNFLTFFKKKKIQIFFYKFFFKFNFFFLKNTHKAILSHSNFFKLNTKFLHDVELRKHKAHLFSSNSLKNFEYHAKNLKLDISSALNYKDVATTELREKLNLKAKYLIFLLLTLLYSSNNSDFIANPMPLNYVHMQVPLAFFKRNTKVKQPKRYFKSKSK